MGGKVIAAAICCLLIFTAVAVAQSPFRDLLNRLLGRESVQVTEIEDILANPEKYANKTVTVEGTFGNRTTLEWMEGPIWGIRDGDKDGLTVEVPIDREKYRQMAETTREYDKMIDDFHERMFSLVGKRVRATGTIDTSLMEKGAADGPVLVVEEENIRVVK